MGQLTPYLPLILGSIITLQVWLVKRSFDQEKKHDLLQQAFKFYIENAGKGAAILLNTPNPAPDHIRPLLDNYVREKLTPSEREILLKWAREVAQDNNAPRDERGIAFQLVATLGAEKRIPDERNKTYAAH